MSDRAVTSPAGLRVAHEIRKRIESGHWAVGSILPGEFDLADEFGVSRSSVREGLSALQFAGYVEARRRRGTVVLGSSPPATPRHVRAATSFAEVVDLLEARLVLEPAMMRLAAADPDPKSLDDAAEIARGMGLALEDRSSAGLTVDTDHRLHAVVARICRNEPLQDQLTTLLERASGPIWRTSQEAAWTGAAGLANDWVHDHIALIDALASGDGTVAETVCRGHLLSAVTNATHCSAMPPSQVHRLRQLHDQFQVDR